MYDYKSLLDARREGQEFSLADINRALQDAGDLAPDRGEGMAAALPIEREAIGETASTGLVGRCEAGHKEAAWPGWSRYLDHRNEQAAK